MLPSCCYYCFYERARYLAIGDDTLKFLWLCYTCASSVQISNVPTIATLIQMITSRFIMACGEGNIFPGVDLGLERMPLAI